MRKTLITALVAASALSASPAAAAALMFSGYTNGCFGAACTVTGSKGTQTAAYEGLTFTNQSFSGTASGGSSLVKLGTFALSSNPDNYNNAVFKLLVSFVTPGSASPSGNTYTAQLMGTVQQDEGGGVYINFNNTPVKYSYPGGTFTFQVSDANVYDGESVRAAGLIRAAVPEPATWAMMLMGLGMIGFGLRSRRKPSVRVTYA